MGIERSVLGSLFHICTYSLFRCAMPPVWFCPVLRAFSRKIVVNLDSRVPCWWVWAESVVVVVVGEVFWGGAVHVWVHF